MQQHPTALFLLPADASAHLLLLLLLQVSRTLWMG
jgi:hypothetical protein